MPCQHALPLVKGEDFDVALTSSKLEVVKALGRLPGAESGRSVGCRRSKIRQPDACRLLGLCEPRGKPLCHVGSRAAPASNETFGQQLVVRLQNNRARNAQLLGQVAGRRQPRAWRELA